MGLRVSAGYQLFIPGPPRGQGRPRFARVGNGVRTYTDKETDTYAQLVQGEWIAAGRPVIPDGPYVLDVLIFLARPKTHFRKDGRLSAQGLRNPRPTRKPDRSNVYKLVEDALVACGAIPDDAKNVDGRNPKDWAGPGYPEGVLVRAWSLAAAIAGAGVELGEQEEERV